MSIHWVNQVNHNCVVSVSHISETRNRISRVLRKLKAKTLFTWFSKSRLRVWPWILLTRSVNMIFVNLLMQWTALCEICYRNLEHEKIPIKTQSNSRSTIFLLTQVMKAFALRFICKLEFRLLIVIVCVNRIDLKRRAIGVFCNCFMRHNVYNLYFMKGTRGLMLYPLKWVWK